MADLVSTIRNEAIREEIRGMPFDDALPGVEADRRDARSAVTETPQEAHERSLAETAAEESIDVLEGMKALQQGELVTWHVHRIAGANGEPLRSGPSEFCGVLGTSQMTQENIAALFGGGRYRVRGRYSDGKFAGERRINIAADARRTEAVTATSQSGFSMSEFLALQAQRDTEARREREDERRNSEARWNRIIELAIPVLGGVVTAVVGKPAANTDIPALINALKPAPDSSRGALKETLEIMTAMQGLMGGGGGSETADILRSVAGIATPALQAFLASKQAAPRVRVNAPRPPAPGAQPTTVVAAPVAPEPLKVKGMEPVREPVVLEMDRPSTVHVNPATQPGADLSQPSEVLSAQEQAMFEQVKPQVEILVGIAKADGDPVETADAFFENALLPLPDAGYSAACDFLEHPKFLTRAALFNSELMNYRPFFEAFQKRIVERIKLESGETSAPG